MRHYRACIVYKNQSGWTVECVRIATWNIWHSEWELEERTNGISETLKRENCDVVLIQENTKLGSSTTAEIIAEATGLYPTLGSGRDFGVAILTKEEPSCVYSTDVARHDYGHHGRYMALAVSINSIKYYLGSAHLAWGSDAEPYRLREIAEINKHAQKHAEEVTIIGGDFNAVQDSSTVRHINGLDGPNLWIDAWDVAGDGAGFTSVGNNRCGVVTAAKRGNYNPGMLPSRRIDHLFIREWVYGRTGYPVEAHLIGLPPEENSDHYGVSVELLELLNSDTNHS